MTVPVVGGGEVRVAHGDALVLTHLTEDVGFWRNSIGLDPDAARRLAALLIEQADRADACHAEVVADMAPSGD